MEVKEYSTRISEFRNALFELHSARAFTMRDVLLNKPSQFDVEGVYAIYTLTMARLYM